MFSRNNSKLIKKSSMSCRRRVVPLNPGPLSLISVMMCNWHRYLTQKLKWKPKILIPTMTSSKSGWSANLMPQRMQKAARWLVSRHLVPWAHPSKDHYPAGAYMVDDDTDTDIDFVTPKNDGRHQVQDDVETDLMMTGLLKYHQAAKKRIAVRQLVDVEDLMKTMMGQSSMRKRRTAAIKLFVIALSLITPSVLVHSLRHFWKRTQKSN